MAARANLVKVSIKPALEAGHIVICDRYIHSTYAYQCAGNGLSVHYTAICNEMATGGLEPDITYIMDLPVNIARGRLTKRPLEPADHYDIAEWDFIQRVREAYIEMASPLGCPYPPSSPVYLVNAQDPIDKIAAQIATHTDSLCAQEAV